jgi:hypothetical protein
MTVYAIALLNTLDRERYGTYQQGFMEIFSIAASCWPWTRRRRSRRVTGCVYRKLKLGRSGDEVRPGWCVN